MDSKQKQRVEYRNLPHGYYHLCTDGWSSGKLFNTQEEFASGMSLVAVLAIKYEVKIYAFELMPNHIHMLLSGTGRQCLDCFYFLVRRINKRLQVDGFPPLPEDYWFKLIPILDKVSMRHHIVYLARNAYEKGICTPCGYPWGSSYLLYNDTTSFIRGTSVSNCQVRKIEKLLGCREKLPSDWEIHPILGVLPVSFVCLDKVRSLFPSVKDYMTHLVKDYESYVRISELAGEKPEWTLEDARIIAEQVCDKLFPGKKSTSLSADEKCRLAVRLNTDYQLDSVILSQTLSVSVRILSQIIRSKEYGKRLKK